MMPPVTPLEVECGGNARVRYGSGRRGRSRADQRSVRGIVVMRSRFATDARSTPLSGPTRTSLVSPRTEEVIGATVIRSRRTRPFAREDQHRADLVEPRQPKWRASVDVGSRPGWRFAVAQAA